MILYLVDFFADDDGVVAADLLRPEFAVVEGAVVLVRVPVDTAVQAPASAFESCKNSNPVRLMKKSSQLQKLIK